MIFCFYFNVKNEKNKNKVERQCFSKIQLKINVILIEYVIGDKKNITSGELCVKKTILRGSPPRFFREEGFIYT